MHSKRPAATRVSSDIITRFAEELRRRDYIADDDQRQAIEALAGWLEGHMSGRPQSGPAGIYLWGGVGRGKSFVMDSFFAAAPLAEKRRVHFHAFLQELQRRMLTLAGHADPLVKALRGLAGELKLLCFDEFHVHDIGDAMLLRRVLDVLVSHGVGLVTTSNYPPSGLCPNPLYRERFVPAIRMLEERFAVLLIDGETDYRQRSQPSEHWGEYLWPETTETERYLSAQLGFSNAEGETLQVNHHPLAIRARGSEGVWLTFDSLCGQPHSTRDYLWLVEQFPLIALTGVPPLNGQPTDACQRLLNFIDITYDAGTRLLLQSDHDLDTLCEGSPHQDFQRTRSRLSQLHRVEMGRATPGMSGLR